MVSCGHNSDIAGQLIELHQQKRHDALYFAGFVDVTALLSNGVKLIEKQYARHCARVFKQPCEASVCLSKICTDKRVVAHCEQGHSDRLRYCLGERSLTVTRRAGQKHAVTRLHPLRTQEIRASLLLDKLACELLGRQSQDEVFQLSSRFRFDHEVASGKTRATQLAGSCYGN